MSNCKVDRDKTDSRLSVKEQLLAWEKSFASASIKTSAKTKTSSKALTKNVQ